MSQRPPVELADVEVVAEGLAFPEGPTVLPDGSVAVVELTRGRITRIGHDGAASVLAETGGGPNGLAVGPAGRLYVCNNGGFPWVGQGRIDPCIQRVDPDSGTVEVLYADCDGAPFGGPNDLMFDSDDTFYFTDYAGGAVYHAAADGSSIRRVVDNVPGANGIGVSPDGSRLYVALTDRRQLVSRRITGPGQVEPSPGYGVQAVVMGGDVDPATLVVGLGGAEEFDSLAMEADGRVCVATLMIGGITAVAPDGSYEQYLVPPALADPVVTNICFAGPDLRTAYITASVTGRLLRCPWPRPGLRLRHHAPPT